MGSVAELVDRFFPLGWIGFYLLLPVSGWAPVMFASWFDQRRDLSALRSVLTHGRADAIADSVIGPGYIAAAAWLHSALGVDAADSLVAVTRASYALSVACGMVLVGVVLRRLVNAPPLVSLGGQFLFAALSFASGTWHWSDVPWSHFFAAFLAVALYATRFAPRRASLPQAGAIGVLLALLALTRSFELVAIVAGWGIALGLFSVLRLSSARTWSARHVASGIGTFVAATAAVYLTTGKRDVFFLYANHLDQQSGNVLPAEIATTPTFSLGLVPTKLVQLFVEPCYYSLCSVADYAGGASPLPPALAAAGGNERLWRLPLAIQLPSLILLPFCLLAMIAIVTWLARNRPVAATRVREARLLTESTIVAVGVVIGYASSTMTGSSHLRYGFARDFLLPALLASVVAVALVSSGLWLLLRRLGSSRRVSPEFGFVGLSVVGAAVLVFGLAVARANGIPRIESRQLGSVAYTARCGDTRCDVSVAAMTRAGRQISLPEASTLTFGCGSARPRFTLYVATLGEGVRLMRACHDARLVSAWPTVMGLPPGSYELKAVAVRNVRPSNS